MNNICHSLEVSIYPNGMNNIINPKDIEMVRILNHSMLKGLVFVEQEFTRYSGIVFEGSDASQDAWLNFDVACIVLIYSCVCVFIQLAHSRSTRDRLH